MGFVELVAHLVKNPSGFVGQGSSFREMPRMPFGFCPPTLVVRGAGSDNNAFNKP